MCHRGCRSTGLRESIGYGYDRGLQELLTFAKDSLLPTVHPSSIVDPAARLAEDVEIGPWCHIGPDVTIGPGCRLIGNIYLHGRVELGSGNVLYPGVCIGFEPQSYKWTPDTKTAGVRIGDHNLIREGVTIHHATTDEHPTTLGSHNMLMTQSHVGHDAIIGNHCIFASAVLIAGHAMVSDRVNLGGGAMAHQFSRIGRLAMLGGHSAISSDLPPFCVGSGLNNLIGLNLVGLRRSGMSKTTIGQIRWAFRVMALDGHTNPVAAELIRKRAGECDAETAGALEEMAEFIVTTKRGLIPHALISQTQKMHR